jgi:hypothetical protein
MNAGTIMEQVEQVEQVMRDQRLRRIETNVDEIRRMVQAIEDALTLAGVIIPDPGLPPYTDKPEVKP